jgi:DNA-binding response OmpR family regulator
MELSLLTPTEKRLFVLLSDAMFHEEKELTALLNEDMPSSRLLTTHLSNLRAKLEKRAMGIGMLRENGSTYYRLTRRITVQ